MDSKRIQDIACNNFESYLFDCPHYSLYDRKDDKEPFWDGSLFKYADSNKSNNSYVGKISVQIKGKLVTAITTGNQFSYPIETTDLKAFLNDATIFIVCQINKNDHRDYKLFYKLLLPETVKSILKGKSHQQTITVKFKEIPEPEEFELMCDTFLIDKVKQASFANMKTPSLLELSEKGINKISCYAPINSRNALDIMKYLSSHLSNLYAIPENNFGIEIPIEGGPMRMSFLSSDYINFESDNGNFSIKADRIIDKGAMYVKIGNIITIHFHPENIQNITGRFEWAKLPKSLNNAITDIEFVLNIYRSKSIHRLNLSNINIPKDAMNWIAILQAYSNLYMLTRTLHVFKDIDLSTLKTEDDFYGIEILYSSLLKGKTFKIKKDSLRQYNPLWLLKLGNITLLLWLSINSDEEYIVKDIFNTQEPFLIKDENNKISTVTPYSLLSICKLWETCDNIPFNNFIQPYEDISSHNKTDLYAIANFDVLSMLTAYDNLKNTDSIKADKLINAANTLNDWLIDNDDTEQNIIHYINKYQIIKRQRPFNEEELVALNKIIQDSSTPYPIRTCACILLENKDSFTTNFSKCSQNEQETIKKFPIWKLLK